MTILFMIGSFYFLSLFLTELPVGTTYAVWTGVGITGTVILGVLLLGESRKFARILCIMLILAGIIGLRLVTPG